MFAILFIGDNGTDYLLRTSTWKDPGIILGLVLLGAFAAGASKSAVGK